MSKTPKLRFKEFSDNKITALNIGEIVDYKKGYAFKSASYIENGIRIIKISDTTESSIKKIGQTFIERDKINEYREWQLKEDDVIVSTVGSRPPLYLSMVGKVILIPNICTGSLLNQNLVKLIPKNSLNNKYLYNLLKKKRYLNYIENICRGNANQVSITLEDLFQYKVYIPQIEEQQKIANFFSLIDKKIEKQQEKVEALKDYKKGMMQKIFSQEIRFKGDNGEEYGEWEEKKLGDYIIEYTEKTTINNQYPVLTSSRNGLMLQCDYFKNRQITTDDNTGYFVLPYGYITFRSRSDDGIFVFNENKIIEKGIISYFYPVFTFNNNLDNYYGVTYMNNYLKKEIFKEVVGTSQLVLSINKLKKLKIKYPCLQEQQKIANLLSKIDIKITKEQEKLDSLNQWKKGLLQQMFV